MTSARLIPFLVGASLFSALAAPAAAQAAGDPCADLLDSATEHLVDNAKAVRGILLADRRCRIRVTLRGEAVYTSDFRGISGFSPDGSFTLEEDGEVPVRRLELADNGRGGITALYTVGREARAFDGAAQDWLAERLLLLYRRAGLAAAERAEWLLRTRGIDELVAEARKIHSPSGSAEYMKRAVATPQLSDAQLIGLLRSSLPSSSSEGRTSPRRAVLMSVADSRQLDGPLAAAYLEAVAATSSPSSQRDLLQRAIGGGKAPPPLVIGVLRTAGSMSSSSGQVAVLRAVAAEYRLQDDAMLDAYLDVVRGMSASSEQRESLAAAAAQTDLTAAQLVRLLRTAGTMHSASAQADLLVQVARIRPLEGEARAAYVDVATAISSSSHRARALGALDGLPR